MSAFQLPRKRTILAWHRWLGFASAVFLVILSITGLLLNHTERLGLDDIQIRNGFILDRYGMVAENGIKAYAFNQSNVIAHLDGQLFYDQQALTTGSSPVGIIEGEQFSVIATESELIYITKEGELVEKLGSAQLPYSRLTAVGKTVAKNPVLVTDIGSLCPDENWIEFDRYQTAYTVTPLIEIKLSSEQANLILENFQGGGVSLYRVMLDLHSGRLFGWGGRTLMDLTAIAILILVSSGIGGYFRKARRATPQVTN